MGYAYDETSPESIERYAQRLIGKSFADVVKEDEIRSDSEARGPLDYAAGHENKKGKGGLGELIEERFFHYKCNNDSRPDFDKAGVELKVTPYKRNKNGTYAAKERLVITMIDYFKVVQESFEESHFWSKARLILLIYYLYQAEIENRLDYKIGYARLFSVPQEDLNIIKHDYEVIVEKIRDGKAHELSEGDTLYLGAASKAATSKSRRKQPFSHKLAKPRAFAFKNAYMTYVLNTYIIMGKDTYEPIMKADRQIPFEAYVENKVNGYRGWSVEGLCREFNVGYGRMPKNLGAMLAYRILGIKGNQAAEFVKANIVVKTIRIESNNIIKENMSLPAFKFKELAEESWDSSTLGTYLSETRFLFVVYKYDGYQVLRLKGSQFWNIPCEDLNGFVRLVWERTRELAAGKLKIWKKKGRYCSNLPKSKNNPVCHVRPHGRDADDMDELPDGRRFPKQCFWLNGSYILSQLKSEFLS